jgi:hypothetical protein
MLPNVGCRLAVERRRDPVRDARSAAAIKRSI